MFGLKFPKPTRKPKARKPLKRSWIKKRKGSFKACDNGKRKPHRDALETEAWALQKQKEKLTKLSTQQLAVGATLSQYGIRYEYEAYWKNGDYPIFSDLYLVDHRLTIEVDDESHRYQQRADHDRAMYLARAYGVGTIRYTNRQVMSGYAEEDLLARFGRM